MSRETARLTRKIRLFNVASGVLSAITAMSAWAVISQSPELVAQIMVSVVSLISALLVSVPSILDWRQRNGEMLALCGEYGRIYGELLDQKYGLARGSSNPAILEEAVENFQKIKARKDALGLSSESVELNSTRRWSFLFHCRAGDRDSKVKPSASR
ncbi:hypothetical protein [Streptomyces sp. NPDC088350]|uniref:hypothetical protein n=1 Tax=Streptomyces sp. NPDC088350 TaxID=3365854 RepID=UPI003828F888